MVKERFFSVLVCIKKKQAVLGAIGRALLLLSLFVSLINLSFYDIWFLIEYLVIFSSIFLLLPEFALSLAPDPLPIRDMTCEQMIAFVVTTHGSDDWSTINAYPISENFFKKDPKLRLTIDYQNGVQAEDFQEPWAKKFPDQSATGYWCELLYDKNLIRKIILVDVDGGRALLPAPQSQNNLKVDTFNYKVAEIFNRTSDFDYYFKWSGLIKKADDP